MASASRPVYHVLVVRLQSGVYFKVIREELVLLQKDNM